MKLPFEAVIFKGFTAPLPVDEKLALAMVESDLKYFNGGSGADWISRVPRFACLHTNLTVYVQEAGRVRHNRRLNDSTDVHRLEPRSDGAFCYSVALSPGELEAIRAKRAAQLLVVRDIRELSPGYHQKWLAASVPALTALFPLQYYSTRSKCVDLADVCIPDNYLVKTISAEAAAVCLQAKSALQERPRTLIMAGKLYGRKGQLQFLRAVDRTLLQNYTLKFYGRILDKTYYQEVHSECTRRQVRCEFKDEVGHGELMVAYSRAQGVISFGIDEIDPNPRVIVESLACNVPVLVGPTTRLAATVEAQFPSIGRRVSQIDHADAVFREWLRRDYGTKPRQFFERFADEKTVYLELFGNITFNSSWRTSSRPIYSSVATLRTESSTNAQNQHGSPPGRHAETAICVVGSTRNFAQLAEHLRQRFLATRLLLDFFFVFRNTKDAMRTSKGKTATGELGSDSLQAMTAAFAPTAILESTTRFEANSQCPSPPGAMIECDHSGQAAMARTWETLVGIKECFDLVQRQEAKKGRLYRSVVRLRPDIIFYSPINPTLLQPAIATFPKGRMSCSNGIIGNCANDHLAFLPRAAAAAYFNMADHYVYCRDDALRSENASDPSVAFWRHLMHRKEPTLTWRVHSFITAELNHSGISWQRTEVPYTLVREGRADCRRAAIANEYGGAQRLSWDQCNICSQFVATTSQIDNFKMMESCH